MLSYVFYSYHQAFLEDDDDVVAVVSGGQLVLLYFAALAVYTSDVSDQKQAAFTGVGFGAVLVVIFFASFLVAAYVTVLDVVGYSSLRKFWSAQGSSSAPVHVVEPATSSFEEDEIPKVGPVEDDDTREDTPHLEETSSSEASDRRPDGDVGSTDPGDRVVELVNLVVNPQGDGSTEKDLVTDV